MRNLAAVLLAAGERTEEASLALLEKQLGARVPVVRKTPLSAALGEFYEVALDLGAEWCLRLDADVLLAPGALEKMMQEAEVLSPEVVGYQATFLDKLTGVPRRCGQKLYRRSSLEIFRKSLPENSHLLNPEQPVIHGPFKNLWAKNFELILGLHDVEQYSCDLYRKGFMFAFKHLERIGKVVPFWKGSGDPDFAAALAGLAAGIRHQGEMHFDAGFFPRENDKPPLGTVTEKQVAEWISSFDYCTPFC